MMSRVQSWAIEALGRICGRVAVPSLVDFLRDDDSRVRTSAALALGRIGDMSAVEALKHAKHSEPLFKRSIYRHALRRIQHPKIVAALEKLRSARKRAIWWATIRAALLAPLALVILGHWIAAIGTAAALFACAVGWRVLKVWFSDEPQARLP